MTYDTRRTWDRWARRDLRAVRRHLAAASPRLLPSQLPPTDEDRAAELLSVDAYDFGEEREAERRLASLDTPLQPVTEAQRLAGLLQRWQADERMRLVWQADGNWDDELEAEHAARAAELRAMGVWT